MIKTTLIEKKSQKPIDADIHLKYVCPNCCCEHWIKYLAATVPSFKVVCDCGTIFRIKRISEIKIRYAKKKQKEEKKSEETSIPDRLLNESIRILCGYGYSREEAEELVSKAYNESIESVADLVKQSLVINRSDNE